jgi:hypothetical protein
MTADEGQQQFNRPAESKVQMSLPGRYVSAGTLAHNYGETNVAPTQKEKPLLSSKSRPHFQTHKWSWNEHKLGDGSQWGPKPGTSVLPRVSSNLLGWTGLKASESTVSRSRRLAVLISIVGSRYLATTSE